MCCSPELEQVLSLNVLPNLMITLIPSNKYRDEECFVFWFLKDLCDPCHQRPCLHPWSLLLLERMLKSMVHVAASCYGTDVSFAVVSMPADL